MKKIYSFLVLGMLMLTVQSCLHDDKELFDKSAAERIQESVENTKNLLTSSPNGWLMYYYTGEEYSGGGYNVLMRFTSSTAYVSADYSEVDSVSHSSWDVKKDQGVVISFDTYNGNLHIMSNPSSAALDGQEGDYEFVVLSMSEDTIYVRGKKWDNHMVMVRMPENITWTEYLTQVKEATNHLAQTYTTSSGATVTLDFSSNRIYAGDDSNGMPFTITPEGLIFPEAYEIDGKEVTSLALDQATGELSDTSIGSLEPYIVPLSEQVMNGVWYLGPDGMSSSVLSKCNTLATTMSSVGFYCYFLSLGQYYSSSTKWSFNIGLLSGSTVYQTYSQFDITAVDDNTVKLSNGEFDSIGNGEYIYNYYGGKGIFEMFGLDTDVTTWKLSTDNPLRPSYIRFENADDPTEYFCAYSDVIHYPFGD